MKNQVLFSSKDKSKKLKCCLLQFLFGALRVKLQSWLIGGYKIKKILGLHWLLKSFHLKMWIHDSNLTHHSTLKSLTF